MDITGRIIWAGERRGGTSQQSGKQWASQDFTIESRTNGVYGEQIQRVNFNVFGIDKLQEYNLAVGTECTVTYGVNAREYNGKWYNDVRASRVEVHAPQQYAQQNYSPAPAWQQPAPQGYAQPQQYTQGNYGNTPAGDNTPF